MVYEAIKHLRKLLFFCLEKCNEKNFQIITCPTINECKNCQELISRKICTEVQEVGNYRHTIAT